MSSYVEVLQELGDQLEAQRPHCTQCPGSSVGPAVVCLQVSIHPTLHTSYVWSVMLDSQAKGRP